jgi:hypothetical protein
MMDPALMVVDFRTRDFDPGDFYYTKNLFLEENGG